MDVPLATTWFSAITQSHGLGHYQISTNGESPLFLQQQHRRWRVAITGRNANTINWAASWGSVRVATLFQGYAALSRWAATNPTGDGSSRYAYVLMDLLPSGTSGVYASAAHASRVQRQIVHFKKSSQFVVEYTDAAVSVGETINAYYHYALSGVNAWTDATITPSSRIASVVHGSSARLNSQFLSADGNAAHIALVVDNANGSFSGGNGTTARPPSRLTDGNTRNTAARSAVAGGASAVRECHLHMPAVTQPVSTGTGGTSTCVQVPAQRRRSPASPVTVRS